MRALALALVVGLASGARADDELDTDNDARVIPLNGGRYLLPPGYFYTRLAHANVDNELRRLSAENEELKARSSVAPIVVAVLGLIGTAMTVYFAKAAVNGAAP